MGDGEGNKAMTIYIVACFLLAMVALVGYKLKNDEREERSAEYVNLAGQFADMSGAYAPNINDYYRKVEAGLIKLVDKDVRDKTHVSLGKIAEDLGILEGAGNDDHLDMGTPREKVVNKMYVEYTLQMKLKNVTQTEWAVFLSQAQHETHEYAHVQSIRIDRENRRFDRMNIVADNGKDDALWTVEIEFVWFGPLSEA